DDRSRPLPPHDVAGARDLASAAHARARPPLLLSVAAALAGADIDLGGQRAVHGTLVGDVKKPRALCLVEHARKSDLALDAVEHAFLGLALGTILRVNL